VKNLMYYLSYTYEKAWKHPINNGIVMIPGSLASVPDDLAITSSGVKANPGALPGVGHAAREGRET